MKRAKITIKNYRGFTDAEPAIIEIGPGFTALLGKNNAGKSSAKLLFYELRGLLNVLAQMNPQQGPGFYPSVQGAAVDVAYLGITDPEELFNNTNARPISIEIEVLDAEAATALGNCVYKLQVTCERSVPQRWVLEAFGTNPRGQKIHSPNGFNPAGHLTVRSPDGTIVVDTVDLFAVLKALADARYYGPFRNAINVGAADHFDLKTGTAFIDLWNGWKTSGVKAQTRAIGQVTEDIRRLFEFDQLEINASTTLHTLMVTIDGHAYRLAELGSGIAQFIMVLGNAATTKPSIVFIDEPETNLHPALQIDFLLALAQ